MITLVLACCTLSAGGAAPLSLRDAIQASLKNNLQVQIARETRVINGPANETIARGTFDWNLNGSVNLSRIESRNTSSSKSDGTQVVTESTTKGRDFSAGLGKAFEWGGSLAVNYESSYSNAEGTYAGIPFTTPKPYGGGINATYTQSLLKGFGRESTAANLIVAQKGSLIADYAYQQTIIELVASTESAYWDVVYAQRNLDNKRQSLALAQKQLKENRIRVEVGTLAPIEVTSAEATVAQREQEIISAEAQLLNAKDVLIRMLYPKGDRPEDLVPTDAPSIGHLSLDESGAIRMALERRVELRKAQLDLESRRVLERAAQNRVRPQLDAFVTYSGGSDNHGVLSSVHSDLASFRNPGYTVGLQFAMPIANHAAKGALAQARASARSSELGLRDQELAIILEVRQAIRNVEAAEKTVKASEKTRFFREKDLESEQKKFDNGMSTNFLVLSKQNDLDTAKATEVQSQIAYAKAVTAFEKAIGNLLEARVPNAKLQ